PWPIAQDFVECEAPEAFMAWYGKISVFFRQTLRLRTITDVHDWHNTITKANTPMEIQLKDSETGVIETVEMPDYKLKELKSDGMASLTSLPNEILLSIVESLFHSEEGIPITGVNAAWVSP
ncbi:12028_t:CDS:2, partial [Acaulospora colombiana]